MHKWWYAASGCGWEHTKRCASVVSQLREEFDRGMDVLLDEEHSIHDVAALLKEFLRDMPDPLLTKELYTAFINTMCEQEFPFTTARTLQQSQTLTTISEKFYREYT